MAAFFRGLLLFLVGAVLGAAAVLVFAPGFTVVISHGAPAAKAAKVVKAPKAAEVVEVAPAPAVASAVAKPAEPAEPVAAVPPKETVFGTVMPSAPAPAPEAVADPALDFKAISEHLILWPNAVTLKTATTVPVMVDGKKVQDLALDVGTVLQVSKVLADGSLETRAKGAKFEIKSALTDFSAEFGKRVAELVAKGTKVDPAFAALAAATPPAAPAAGSPGASAAPAAPAAPKGPLTLAQRVDILYGNKPDAPAAAPDAAAPADPKAADKAKDLDRKMNQLLK